MIKTQLDNTDKYIVMVRISTRSVVMFLRYLKPDDSIHIKYLDESGKWLKWGSYRSFRRNMLMSEPEEMGDTTFYFTNDLDKALDYTYENEENLHSLSYEEWKVIFEGNDDGPHFLTDDPNAAKLKKFIDKVNKNLEYNEEIL